MERIAEPDELMLRFGRTIPSLTLASSSPNRKALLEGCGCHVRICAPEADETRKRIEALRNMHISEESEEEADAERKEANEPEAHEAPETDEKQEDEGNGENPEHSNEEQNCHV